MKCKQVFDVFFHMTKPTQKYVFSKSEVHKRMNLNAVQQNPQEKIFHEGHLESNETSGKGPSTSLKAFNTRTLIAYMLFYLPYSIKLNKIAHQSFP